MGGFFGVASKHSCTLDLFFGVDYHSHLGTKRGGMAVYRKGEGFFRAIHNIENTPFRTKFDRDLEELEGTLGIGCISDNEPQPLLIQSHLGSFAITTVGKINNEAELVQDAFKNGHIHFMEMSRGRINATELVAALINQKSSLTEGASLCPGADPRLHVHSAHDIRRHLRFPGQIRQDTHCHREKGGRFLRLL